MFWHNLLGSHAADLKASHWDRGQFVTTCTVCNRKMVKLPGLPWRLAGGRAA
jgi:hypothetical protein